MDYGVGLDASLRLDWDQEAHVSREAARLGYTSLWTPESGGYDGFHVCAHRWRATAQAHPGGLTTGIAVSPVALRSPLGLAMGAGTVSALTGGRFILGIGTGGLHQRAGREAHGAAHVSPLALMRDYLTVLRGLLDGERITHRRPPLSPSAASGSTWTRPLARRSTSAPWARRCCAWPASWRTASPSTGAQPSR